MYRLSIPTVIACRIGVNLMPVAVVKGIGMRSIVLVCCFLVGAVGSPVSASTSVEQFDDMKPNGSPVTGKPLQPFKLSATYEATSAQLDLMSKPTCPLECWSVRVSQLESRCKALRKEISARLADGALDSIAAEELRKKGHRLERMLYHPTCGFDSLSFVEQELARIADGFRKMNVAQNVELNQPI